MWRDRESEEGGFTKGKRLSQHEAAKNYCSCEQVTEEMMALKERKRGLEVEKALFVKKARRAKACQKKKYTVATSGASDVPSIITINK